MVIQADVAQLKKTVYLWATKMGSARGDKPRRSLQTFFPGSNHAAKYDWILFLCTICSGFKHL